MSTMGSTEEKFPLLYLFMEDGHRSNKEYKKLSFDKGRYQGIATGASNVITQWPGHAISCWTAASLIGGSIIIISMMLLMFTVHPGLQNLTTKCKINHAMFKTNESVIYLVHDQLRWTQPQLDALEEIAHNNLHSKIILILIKNEVDFVKVSERETKLYSSTERIAVKKVVKRDLNFSYKSISKNGKRKLRPAINKNNTENAITRMPNSRKDLQLKINEFVNMLLRRSEEAKRNITATKTVRRIKTLRDILSAHPTIKVINTTYEMAFKHTPLYYSWHTMNTETRLFAIRVLQLWNYGGGSFALPKSNEIPKKSVVTNFTSAHTLLSYLKRTNNIQVGISSFATLPTGLVTIDDEGLHMETKTICHAFFGEILVALGQANISTRPSDVIRNIVKHFCFKGAVDPIYCKSYS